MTSRIFFIISVCFVVGLSNSAFIDEIYKCSISDNDCQKKLFHESLNKISKTGIPELNIPPIDPIHLQDVTVTVLNLVNLTLVDGVVKGAKDCVFTKYSIDIEKGKGHNILVCDVVIKGHYRLRAASPLIESVLGGSEINGEGKGRVKLDKLQLEFIFPVNVVRKDDGEIYISCDYEHVDQRLDVLGGATFAAEKIYLGKQDVSELVMKYLNDNWKFVIKSFGQVFVEKASEFYNSFSSNFFDSVPAKNYIIEDLAPYLKD
ncbi:uncharacterized protein [Battus philenor]|uniref:uncharacterized protein n=1 Tax=Battus philenor TaxID=42288 RepID=UPI0035CF12DA